jgi:EAL domain-containing protein (putative c-di-GMP-specific phosphodiesterase class I)
LRNGRVTGCEALIRWRDPELGLLLPREFIPLAEKNGSIASIDRWVMRASIAAAAKFAAVQPDIRLYFNVSARLAGTADFVDDLVEQARAACVLENIGIEITETDAMRNVDATQQICRALREAGIKVALDDFGTGYSSLSALKQLPLDIVKIDQSFVAGLLTDHHDRVIATTIISIAQQFGFELIAEGVETDEQRTWLRERSCTYAQGFGISHPLPFDTFVTWLAQRTASPTSVAR